MLAELNRCVLELGFVAAYVSPNPCGTRSLPGMHTRYWDPLYERAAHLDVPLIVHGAANRDERSNDIFMGFQLDYQAEEYHAKQFVLRGRVFDRHPDLRMLICHCGGVIERYPSADRAHMVADDFADNLFYDTCAYDTEFLSAAIRQLGPHRMCFGSEVPALRAPAATAPDGRPTTWWPRSTSSAGSTTARRARSSTRTRSGSAKRSRRCCRAASAASRHASVPAF